MQLYISASTYLLGVEVVAELAVVVTVANAEGGAGVAQSELGDAIVPQPRRHFLVGEAAQNQRLVCDLRAEQ